MHACVHPVMIVATGRVTFDLVPGPCFKTMLPLCWMKRAYYRYVGDAPACLFRR